MSGMDRRQAEALDRWLTTDPRDADEEAFARAFFEEYGYAEGDGCLGGCGEPESCEQVETDCNHKAYVCETVVVLDGAGDPDVTVCRSPFVVARYHEPEIGPTCDCDEGRGPEGCEVHG